MNKCDNDQISVPKFLSADFSNIPQNNDGNVSLNQLLFMIVEMKQKLSNLEKKQCVCSTPLNTASDAPILTPILITESLESQNAQSTSPDSAALIDSAAFIDSAASNSAATDSACKSTFAAITNSPSPNPMNQITPSALKDALKVALPPVNSTSGKNQKQTKRTAENRIKTSHDKNKNLVIGKKPSSGVMSWGGAPLTIDCYIGRVDCSVTSDQIKTSVVAMGIDVVGIEENLTRHGLFKSFKLVVRKTDFPALNSPEIWPEGVVFRRFRRPRPPTTGHDDLPNSN